MKNSAFPYCCAASIISEFWYSNSADGDGMYVVEDVDAFLEKNNKGYEQLNNSKMVLVILQTRQYNKYIKTFEKWGFEKLNTVRGNSGNDIHLLIKNTAAFKKR